MGGLIAVLARIGGASAFGRLASRRVRTRASALLATWLLGLAVFIDDYLNALAISSSMKRLTDRFRVSREMLAYVVDSTAAPICVLVPLSTWTVFFAAVLEDSAAAATGQGLSVYIGAIPYMFYAWAAVAIVPLVIVGAIPVFGPMRTAEGQVRLPEESGASLPGADRSSARHADGVGSQGADESAPPDTDEMALPGAEGVVALRAELRGAVLNFLVPILALVGFTWYLGADILKGVTVALALTLVLVAAQRLLSVTELFDTILEGFKSMLLPLGTVVAGFMLKEVNDQLGLAPYVIGVVQPLMTAEFLPLVTFLTIALIAFASGSFWGIIRGGHAHRHPAGRGRERRPLAGDRRPDLRQRLRQPHLLLRRLHRALRPRQRLRRHRSRAHATSVRAARGRCRVGCFRNRGLCGRLTTAQWKASLQLQGKTEVHMEVRVNSTRWKA